MDRLGDVICAATDPDGPMKETMCVTHFLHFGMPSVVREI